MSFQQIAAGLAFALTTSVQPFLTKSVVSAYKFNFPFTILVLRFLTGLIAVEVLRRCNYVYVRPFSVARAKSLALASVCNAVSLLSTVIAMREMNVPMFTALRQCGPLATLGLTVIVMKEPLPPLPNVLAVLLITVGCAAAGIGDLTFDATAYAICIMSVLTLAMYTLLVQKATKKIGIAEVFQINCYNVLPLVMLGSYFNGELEQVWKYPFLLDAQFLIVLCATVISGNLLTYSMFLCTHLNSAMTTNFIGILKNIPQTLVGLFTFGGMSLNIFNIAGLTLNMIGGIIFTVAKHREKNIHKAA